MSTLTSPDARCIGCKRPVKKDQTRCACGDPVRIMTKEERKDVGKANSERLILIEGADRKDVKVSMVKPASPALSEEQAAALKEIQRWFQDWHADQPAVYEARPFRLFGAAGTGKTTLARHLEAALGADIVYGAYTGKAAHVLRRKGVPATTIHSAIYCPVESKEARAQLREKEAELGQVIEEYTEAASYPGGGSPDVWGPLLAQKEELEAQIAILEEALRHGVQFELNPLSPWADADLIVLDEVSMVGEKVGQDIESFGVPVLVLGDPHQLPPVEGGGFYTNSRPDVLLEHVHRQALESPVLRLATAVRQGEPWTDHLVKVNLEEAMAADQILCWKNATRQALTEKIRAKKGRPAGRPVSGDRVMCLVNNKDLNIFNGQQFVVAEANFDHPDGALLLRDDDGAERWIQADPDGFRGLEGEKEAKARRRHQGRVGLFTFAECITVHKAQGSEWDHVYVVDQTHQMSRSTTFDKRRFIYTAITRASERVTLASTEVR